MIRRPEHPLRIWFTGLSENFGLISDRIDRRDYTAGFGSVESFDPDLWDAVLPLAIEEQFAVVSRPEFASKSVLPSSEVMRLCDDKLACAKALEKNGYEKFIIDEHDPQSSQYPYVAKSRQGFAGDGTRIISSPDDETKHQTFLTRPDVFLQRAVSGCTE